MRYLFFVDNATSVVPVYKSIVYDGIIIVLMTSVKLR